MQRKERGQAKRNSPRAFFEEKRAQGAIEYLLLLAAAVGVVSVVVYFMISILGPTGNTLDQQTLDFTCKTINTNSLICGCYECDTTQGGYDTELDKTTLANEPDCNALSAKKNSPLLKWTKRC
jgi:hypothetical protein